MSKFKNAKCIYCTRKIKRHDPNRVMVKVSERVKKPAHLECSQKTN